MRKNDAFKSFLSPVTIAVGMIALVALAFYANINRASAATIIDEQTVWNANYDPADYTNLPACMRYQPLATISVSAIIVKQKALEGTTATNNIYIDGESSDNLNVITDDTFKNYSFQFTPALEFTPYTARHILMANGGAAVYQAINTTSGTSSNPDRQLGYGDCYDPKVLSPEIPWFQMVEDITAPEVEILQPPADATITSTDFLYTFNATFDVDSNWSVFMQLLDATTSIPKKSYFYSGQPTASVVSRSAALPVTYNGDFILQVTARDEITFETAIATRAITMNVTGLKANDLGLVTIESETEAYCNAETEAVAKAICKIAYFLFVPDEAISEDLDAQIAETKSYPPMSWAMILSDTITAEMGTASAAWTIIPTFVDDFFEWLWYILFGLSCLWFSQKLFKA